MKNEHEEHKAGRPLDYNYIEDGIYAGTNQCCSVGLAEVLKKEDITADISLEDVRLDQPFGVSMYVWLPTKDDTPPSPDQLRFGVQVLKELVKQKRKIYAHCKNGHGRTSTLIAAYFIAQGKSLNEAVRLIKERRPSAHLQEGQLAALSAFARSHAV